MEIVNFSAISGMYLKFKGLTFNTNYMDNHINRSMLGWCLNNWKNNRATVPAVTVTNTGRLKVTTSW